MVEQVTILGSGPAGLTAALYAARADLRPLVVEGHQPGGQLMTTTDVENYPGFPEGIQGPELIAAMKRQAGRFGARFIPKNVVSVDFSGRPFLVTTDDEAIETHAVIIATGASARLLGLESERKLMGHGVSACATCDAFFFKHKKVIVVGGGDTAVEEAGFLTRFADRVYVVHRRDKLRASKIMQDRAFNNAKISFIWDTVVADILDVNQSKVTAVRLKNIVTGNVADMPIDGVFIAIGYDPNTGFLGGQVELDAKGFIVCQGDSSRTSVEGVYAAGDVTDPAYKQAVTAAGTGCRAALDCDPYLATLKEG